MYSLLVTVKSTKLAAAARLSGSINMHMVTATAIGCTVLERISKIIVINLVKVIKIGRFFKKNCSY